MIGSSLVSSVIGSTIGQSVRGSSLRSTATSFSSGFLVIGFFLGSSVLFFQCEAIVVSKNILLLICPSTVEVQNQSLFTCFHSLSLFVLLVVSRWHSLCHILSLLTCCHLLSFVVILCHSLSLVVPLVVSCCQLLYHSLPFICFHFYHLLSLFLARCTTCLCFYKRSLKKDYLS